MALVPNTVGDACAAIIIAATPAVGTVITPDNLKTMWEQLAAAILTGGGGVTSATVIVTVTSVTGVLSGGATSGPGLGTAVIS